MENKLEIGVICFACANEYIILLQAWDLYYHVFRRIDKQLPSLTTLDLQARNGYLIGDLILLSTSCDACL